jgi:hypothetical protein
MAFPVGWPPRPATNVRSLRFYQTGTATGNFSDTAYLFSGQAAAITMAPTPYVPAGGEGAANVVAIGTTSQSGVPEGGGQNPHDSLLDPRIGTVVPGPPTPMFWCKGLRITNTHASVNLEFSFDGTHVHGFIAFGTNFYYYDRYEAGIAIRGAGGAGAPTFIIEAW